MTFIILVKDVFKYIVENSFFLLLQGKIQAM